VIRQSIWLPISFLALIACGGARGPHVRPSGGRQGSRASQASASRGVRLRLCSEAPLRLEGPPGAQQSQGCVVRYQQKLSDPADIARLGTDSVERRYVVYVPRALPAHPAPVVFVLPGYGSSAEAAAFYYTHTRFEFLADDQGFVVVYGNGLHNLPPGETDDGRVPHSGYFRGCFTEHSGEGLDVQYTRQILDQLETEVSIDRSRVYATGLSAGGGLSFQLALEAPDMVAAIAPVAGIPFQPSGPWLKQCHPKPGHDKIPIAMLAATSDQFISYVAGPSSLYPQTDYPGMEQTRDAWLSAMGIRSPAQIELLPDRIKGDSYQPHSGLPSSYIELQRYPTGTEGQELWFYKAVGAGHWWPNPVQMWGGLWKKFGKTNQDIDFADHAWQFFRRHSKH
jgi:polyhydroxybutyrate depolymerase